MSTTRYVVGLGEALWDVFVQGCAPPLRRMGGAPANFACHVAQLGLPARAVSAIGQDAAGDELAAGLAGAGVPTLLQRVLCATGEVRIELENAGLPRYDIRPDAAWDHLATTPELLSLAAETRALCFGTLAQRSAESRAALAAFLAAMPQGEGQWRVFDINLRQHMYTADIIRDSLRTADVLKINEEEMEILGRMEGFRGSPQLEQARLLMQRYGLRYVILTCGAIGSYVLGEAVLSYLPTPRVAVVDTVGAGDAFTAGFLAALLKGATVPLAHQRAVELAAWVCTQSGAMPRHAGGISATN